MIEEVKVTMGEIEEEVVVIEGVTLEVMTDLALETEGGNEMVLAIINLEEGEETMRKITEEGTKWASEET
jgi:hypothetical protein